MRRGVANSVLALLIVVVVALCIGSVRLDSATSDEPAHIANGVIKLTAGWLGFFREQPPLMNSITAMPVVAAGYRAPDGWKGADHWVTGRRLLYRSGYDGHRILFLARLPTIALFAALCLVMYAFVLGQTASRAWALAAAVMTGFCPNLMAHGRLATVDLALSFFAFTAAALLLLLIERPTVMVALALGLTTAAAVMSKISGLILGPFFVLVIAGALLMRRARSPRRLFAALALAAVAALLFFDAFTLSITSGDYIRAAYPSLAGPLARLAVPFAEYATNVQTIASWYERGNSLPQYFMGDFTSAGWRLYYPAAFLLKTTIPALLLFIAAIAVVVRRIRRTAHGAGALATLALLAFIVLFMAFAAAGHLALGLRYVLPIYPFVYALIAIALAQTHAATKAQWRKTLVSVVVALIAWHVAENVVAYPSYISYFNESIGGRRNADKFLIDSNLDWGQDLRRLDLWCAENGISRMSVHYFGGGDVDYDMPHVRPLVRYAPGPDLLPPGWFALSRHFHRLSFAPDFWPVDYDQYLAACHARYVTTIGGSIEVYRVEAEGQGPRAQGRGRERTSVQLARKSQLSTR